MTKVIQILKLNFFTCKTGLIPTRVISQKLSINQTGLIFITFKTRDAVVF